MKTKPFKLERGYLKRNGYRLRSIRDCHLFRGQVFKNGEAIALTEAYFVRKDAIEAARQIVIEIDNLNPKIEASRCGSCDLYEEAGAVGCSVCGGVFEP